jgi:hypothetical protein
MINNYTVDILLPSTGDLIAGSLMTVKVIKKLMNLNLQQRLKLNHRREMGNQPQQI